jgi:hypothetical protein
MLEPLTVDSDKAMLGPTRRDKASTFYTRAVIRGTESVVVNARGILDVFAYRQRRSSACRPEFRIWHIGDMQAGGNEVCLRT